MLESIGGYAETPNAFIFSLNNSERLAPFMSKVKEDKTKNAIERNLFYGPKFGDELVIYLDRAYVQDSKAVLGGFYSVPASVKDIITVLKGSPGVNFSPDEVEVFYLDPSMQDNKN